MTATLTRDSLNILVCTRCGGALTAIDAPAHDAAPQERHLRCADCSATFPIRNGIPRFVAELGALAKTAASYGYQWSGFWNGFFDRGDVFGLQFEQTSQYFLKSLGLQVPDVKGATVLDAGTGSGRVPLSIHEMVDHVYAVDMHSGIEAVAARLDTTDNVTVIQANLLALPFKNASFDVAWSSGVLMYSPDPSQVFASVARTVKPGGRFFISVYGKDVNHYRMFRHLLPWAHRLPTPFVYAISALIALPLHLGFNGSLWYVRTFRKGPPPHRVAIFTVEDSTPKSYKSIVLNLFDQLHPHSQSEHSVEEVLGWFSANGFHEMVITEHIGMVAVRGVKRVAD